MYDIEKYYEARSVEEAVRLLNEHPEAMIISGGSDVLIKTREGKFAGTSLVSIHGIEEIKGVRMAENGDIYIGAGTVFSHITNDEIIKEAYSSTWRSSRSGRWTTGKKYWYDRW